MIKRTAESLFWIGRYLERTENHMRLIDVNYHTRHVLMKNKENDIWEKMINSIGDIQFFRILYDEVNETTALQFLTFEPKNSNSLFSCASYIRNNVRALRQLLPSELWDSINGFYLWIRDQDISSLMMQSPYMFYQRMREWLSLINGTADSTMVRDLSWNFIQAGKFFERAENEIRNLQNYLNGRKESVPYDNQANYICLIRLLKSASGYEPFRKQYADRVILAKVMEFLTLHSTFPHSVKYAISSLEIYLQKIKQQDDQFELHSEIALKIVAKIKETLTEFKDYSKGLNLITMLLAAMNRLGIVISETFFQEELVES